ncbi:MAG TPA: potassium transporter [Chromatiales bacterium]|nr:potassium transporter [Chromatiales bacterium]
MGASVLDAILVLLAVAVVAVAAFRKFNLPPILAYLFVGMLVGPYALNWIPESDGTLFLAEFGVVFLLFTIGLEFSLPQLLAMRREVLGLGGGQVAFTALVAGGVAWLFGMPLTAAFVIGGVLAMSSTAIVIKQLTEQLEVSSRHGRYSVGVLLFQDVAVIPFLIVIPVLAGDSNASISTELGLALLKGLFVIGVMLAIGHWLLRPLFHIIASQRSSELFTLAALLFALAAAWLTHLFGLSFALGAFIAGMLLGETEFRHQVEADIRPFRDVLLGLFFVTIGMMLDLAALPAIIHWVLLLVVAIIVFKVVLVTALSRLLGASQGVSLRTGIVLAQGGEFGLVLLSLALVEGLLDPAASQVVLAAIIITMVLAPFLIASNGTIVKRFYSDSYLRNRESQVTEMEEQSEHLDQHVVICGYGRIGQNIARFLDQEGFNYIALDLDPVRVRDARAAGEQVFYGDSTHIENLGAAGIGRAKVLVISFDDYSRSMKILEQVKRLWPELPVLVRTRDDANLDGLQQAGATEVVPETLEASLMLASHLLLLLNVPVSRIVRSVQEVRSSRYQMLRGFFHGQEAESLEQAPSFRERLQSVELPEAAYAVGRTLGALKLREAGVIVTAVRRGGIKGQQPQPDMVLQAEDILVLYGTPEDLAHAETKLLQG